MSAEVSFAIGIHTDEAKAGRDAIVGWNAQIAGSYDKVLKAAQAAGAGLNIGGVANTNIAGIAGLEKSVNALGASIDKMVKSQAAFLKAAQEGVQASAARTTASKAAAQAAETEAQALDRITQRMAAAKAAREAQTQATQTQKAAQDALNASVAAGAGGQVSNSGLLATAKAAQDATVSVEKLTKARNDDEAASNALVKSADSLVGRYAPLIKAQQQLANDRAALTKLQQEGTLTATEEAAVIAGLEAKQRNLDNMQKTLGGSTKAQAQHFQNLKYQINDVVTGFISGQPPMMTFAQQGGQIVQALDGMDLSLSKVKASTWALAGATVATVAVLATVGARIASISSEAKQLDTITKVLNPSLGATAEQLRNISFAVADQGTSRATGMAALTAVIKDARIQSTELAGQIAKVSVDVAAVMGGEVPDWAKKIADAASAGSQGFDKLLGTLPGITAETMKAVRAAEQHGDRLGAAKIAVDALEKQYGGSAKAMQGAWDEAIHQMGRTFDDFLEKIAKSNPAQGLANFMRDAAKGMGWWVNGVPSEIQNATDRAALGGILDRETASLRQLVDGGASGDVLERQQKKVKALQEQYYGLAAAASAAASAQANAAGGGNGGNGNSSIGGQIAGLNEDDRNKLNLATASTERQAAASKLLAGSLSVQARAAAENRIALADMAMQYPALGAGTAETILKSRDFSATLKTLPPELQAVYKQMQDNSANKLAGDVAQAGVALSSASNAAKLNAEASGLGEAAMRRASIEAEVYAHRMDGTAGAVRDALEEQEKFAQEGIWNAFSRGIDQQVAANDRMIAAYGKSDKAVEDATRYNEAYLQTLKEYPESMKDMPAYEDLWTVALNRNIKKLEERDLSKLAKDIAAYSQALRRSQDDLKVEKVAAGLSETSAIDLKARYDALKAMGLTLDKYNELDAATKTIVDNNLNIAAAIAQQTDELARQKDAWNIITGSIEKAFDNIGSSLIDGLVKGQKEALKLSTIVGSIKTQLLTSVAQLGVNTLTNAVGLTNKGDLVSLLGGSSSASSSGAPGQSGGMGGLGGQALSLGSKLVPNSWTSGIMQSVDSWGYNALGIGSIGGWASAAPASVTAATAAPITGAASANAATGVAAAGNTATANTLYSGTASGASGAGVTGGISSLLSSAGVGAGAGMLGGIVGTATNSKAVGGLTGAAGGALGALALSAGPIGIGIAAITGLISGLLSTQKATVGKTASADVTINAGGKSATYGNVQTDNEGDPAAGRALGTALSGIYSIAAMGGGKLTKDFGIGQTQKDGLYVAGSVPYKKFGDDIAGLLRYTLIDQGGLQGGGANTLKALQNSKAKDWDEAAKDIGLGASIDAGNTALKEMIKTLGGVTDAAKKAADESFKPMFDELERAKKLGIDGAYKSLATDQLKAYLDQLRNPPNFTQTEQDMAALKGQFQAAREAYAQLNPEMVTYVDQIEKETKARMAADLNRSLDSQIREVGGRGYITQIQGFLTSLDQNARSLAAVGEPAARANELFNASLGGLLKTLTTDQLTDVVQAFGGSIATFANQLVTASTAVQRVTLNQSLDSQINEASGLSYINQVNGLLTTLSENTRSLAAVGEPATRANNLFNASLGGLLRTLTTDQLSDVVRTFGGDIGRLATQLSTANDNVQQTARFETLLGKIRQDNAQTEITSLNEQINTAKSAQSQWQNLLTSVGNFRASLLTGDLSPLSARDKASESLSQFFAAVDRARGGDVDAAGQVQSLAQAALTANKAYFASSEDYARIFNQVQDGLGGVESTASRQVGLQTSQLSTLQSSLATQQNTLRALQVVPADIAAIIRGITPSNSTDVLNWSRTQDTGTQTQIKRAVLESYTNADIEAKFGGFADIQAARAADPSFNLAEWFKAYGMNEVLNGQRSIPGFATGTDYAPGGLAWVGEKGPELMQLPAGSRIYPHSESMGIAKSWGAANDRFSGQNVLPFRSGNGSGSSSNDLLNEVKAMRADNARANKDHVDLMKSLVVENAELRRQNAVLVNEAKRTRQQLSDTEGKRQPRAAYK